jgi:hypothetical protein
MQARNARSALLFFPVELRSLFYFVLLEESLIDDIRYGLEEDVALDGRVKGQASEMKRERS